MILARRLVFLTIRKARLSLPWSQGPNLWFLAQPRNLFLTRVSRLRGVFRTLLLEAKPAPYAHVRVIGVVAAIIPPQNLQIHLIPVALLSISQKLEQPRLHIPSGSSYFWYWRVFICTEQKKYPQIFCAGLYRYFLRAVSYTHLTLPTN